jgi:hypothetical protein
MDPIWKNIPNELVEHVCNQLPKVRRVSWEFKNDLQFGLLDWVINRMTRLEDHNRYRATDNLIDILFAYNGFEENDENVSVLEDMWYDCSQDIKDHVIDLISCTT